MPSSKESAARGLWVVILGYYFAFSHANRPQHHNRQGYTDSTSVHWRRDGSNRPEAVSFLVTQCKRRDFEFQNTRWSEGEVQLERYLRELRTKNCNSRLYSIVVVG